MNDLNGLLNSAVKEISSPQRPQKFFHLVTAISAPGRGPEHHQEDFRPELQAGHGVDAVGAEGELLHRVPPELLLRRRRARGRSSPRWNCLKPLAAGLDQGDPLGSAISL